MQKLILYTVINMFILQICKHIILFTIMLHATQNYPLVSLRKVIWNTILIMPIIFG